jgi:hypothetical protein
MPEEPPVTTATLPARSTPEATSAAVVVGPKPVGSGSCSVRWADDMDVFIIFLVIVNERVLTHYGAKKIIQ